MRRRRPAIAGCTVLSVTPWTKQRALTTPFAKQTWCDARRKKTRFADHRFPAVGQKTGSLGCPSSFAPLTRQSFLALDLFELKLARPLHVNVPATSLVAVHLQEARVNPDVAIGTALQKYLVHPQPHGA